MKKKKKKQKLYAFCSVILAEMWIACREWNVRLNGFLRGTVKNAWWQTICWIPIGFLYERQQQQKHQQHMPCNYVVHTEEWTHNELTTPKNAMKKKRRETQKEDKNASPQKSHSNRITCVDVLDELRFNEIKMKSPNADSLWIKYCSTHPLICSPSLRYFVLSVPWFRRRISSVFSVNWKREIESKNYFLSSPRFVSIFSLTNFFLCSGCSTLFASNRNFSRLVLLIWLVFYAV